MTPLVDLARAMFAAAVAAVQPGALLRRVGFLPDGVEFGGEVLSPSGRLVLVAIGKAAPGLAAAFHHRTQRVPDVTFVLAPHGVPVPAEVAPFTRHGRHPLPDSRGAEATRELLALVGSLSPADGVVLLLSGGGSALLAEPLPGRSLEELASLVQALLAAGVSIHELNTVRRHLLAAAGGRLAATCAAPMLALALSDVQGNNLVDVASGPAVADPTTGQDALTVMERYDLAAVFPDIAAFLGAAARGGVAETPKPGDPRLTHAHTLLLGGNGEALAAAADTAAHAGFRAVQLTRSLRGEAREVGTALANLARSLVPGEPVAVLAGGETTVTVRGSGCGGRNLELALAAALQLADVPERCLLAAGTDGIDGVSPAAGAVVDGGTLARGRGCGRDAIAALAANDAWGYFAGLPDAIVTGATGTNVADLVFILAAGALATFLPAKAHLAAQLPVAPR
jgi:glycerate 2-kinase